MAEEPDNMVLVMLREIRAKQEDHSQVLGAHTQQFERLEKRFDDLFKVVRYSLGQSTETQFRQASKNRASTSCSTSWKSS